MLHMSRGAEHFYRANSSHLLHVARDLSTESLEGCSTEQCLLLTMHHASKQDKKQEVKRGL